MATEIRQLPKLNTVFINYHDGSGFAHQSRGNGYAMSPRGAHSPGSMPAMSAVSPRTVPAPTWSQRQPQPQHHHELMLHNQGYQHSQQHQQPLLRPLPSPRTSPVYEEKPSHVVCVNCEQMTPVTHEASHLARMRLTDSPSSSSSSSADKPLPPLPLRHHPSSNQAAAPAKQRSDWSRNTSATATTTGTWRGPPSLPPAGPLTAPPRHHYARELPISPPPTARLHAPSQGRVYHHKVPQHAARRVIPAGHRYDARGRPASLPQFHDDVQRRYSAPVPARSLVAPPRGGDATSSPRRPRNGSVMSAMVPAADDGRGGEPSCSDSDEPLAKRRRRRSGVASTGAASPQSRRPPSTAATSTTSTPGPTTVPTPPTVTGHHQQQQHPLPHRAAQLREWGPLFFGSAATAECFVVAVQLRAPPPSGSTSSSSARSSLSGRGGDNIDAAAAHPPPLSAVGATARRESSADALPPPPTTTAVARATGSHRYSVGGISVMDALSDAATTPATSAAASMSSSPMLPLPTPSPASTIGLSACPAPRSKVTVRARVRPRELGAPALLLQRTFDVLEMRGTLPEEGVPRPLPRRLPPPPPSPSAMYRYPPPSSSAESPRLRAPAAAGRRIPLPDSPAQTASMAPPPPPPLVPRRQSTAAVLQAAASSASTQARPPPSAPSPKMSLVDQFRTGLVDLKAMMSEEFMPIPIHFEYARALPVLAALFLSGHLTPGDELDLPLPHPEAWPLTVAWAYGMPVAELVAKLPTATTKTTAASGGRSGVGVVVKQEDGVAVAHEAEPLDWLDMVRDNVAHLCGVI